MNIVILGAGPGGLCLAWNLIQDGHRVVLLEKETVCGGQSITFKRDGFSYDLGPHNIHSKRASIIQFLKENLPGGFAEHQIQPQIYFRGRRINYPLVGIQVLQNLPILTSIKCAMSFLFSRLNFFWGGPSCPSDSYEAWVINRFGRSFYNIFFRPYTEKTWKVPPRELSNIIAKKRIAIRSISELISNILFKKERYHPENVRLIKSYYSDGGVGEISDFFLKGFLEKGGELHLGCTVEKIALKNEQVTHIHYKAYGQQEHLNLETDGGIENWQVYSTIPINELMLMLEGNVPEAVTSAAQKLDFTAEVFLYLNVNREQVFNTPLLYFSEDEFPFNRIYDVGLFNRSMVPAGKNALCLELTCSYGDALWNMEADELYEKCIKPLEKHGLMERSWVEGYHVRKLNHAYPRFRVGYEKSLRVLYNYLEGITNLMSFGRQGLFSYANVDDVIWMAFEMAKELPYRKRFKLAIEEMLPDYIDF